MKKLGKTLSIMMAAIVAMCTIVSFAGDLEIEESAEMYEEEIFVDETQPDAYEIETICVEIQAEETVAAPVEENAGALAEEIVTAPEEEMAQEEKASEAFVVEGENKETAPEETSVDPDTEMVTTKEEATTEAARDEEDNKTEAKQPESKQAETKSEETKPQEPKQEKEEQVPALNEPAVYRLEKLPFEIKGELPKEWKAGDIAELTLEVKNITNNSLENLKIKLQSKDSRFAITSFKTKEEAKAWMDEPDKESEEAKAKREEVLTKKIAIQSLVPGAKAEVKVIIIVEKDMVLDANGLETKAFCELNALGKKYECENTLKIKAKEAQPVDPETETKETEPETEATETEPIEEPTETEATENEQPSEVVEQESNTEAEPDTDIEEPTEAEEPETEIDEEEPSDTEQPSEQPTTPEAEKEPESTTPEELETFEVIPSEDESETAEEWEYVDDYYDDWVYYSGDAFDGGDVNTATPHVLVKAYAHKGVINTGDAFVLEVTLLNTSQKNDVEGIIVKVETSESLSLANGTNTLFVNNLSAGGTVKKSLNLLASADCKETIQNVKLAISYEYVDNRERKSGTSEESISIPITQKARLEIGDPVCDDMEAGSEGVISISYVNKGHTTLNNMEAVLVLEGADAESTTKYLGNVEPGANGTIDFLVTPSQGGTITGTVTLTYEDASQKEITTDIDVSFEAMEAYVPEEFDFGEIEEFDSEEEKGLDLPIIIAIAAGAVVLIGIIVLVICKKKKKAKQSMELDDEWFNSKS